MPLPGGATRDVPTGTEFEHRRCDSQREAVSAIRSIILPCHLKSCVRVLRIVWMLITRCFWDVLILTDLSDSEVGIPDI